MPMIPADWPRPLALLVTLLRVDGDGAQAGAPPSLEHGQILARDMSLEDWDQFVELAIDQHRVSSILAPQLVDLGAPEHVCARAAAAVRENAVATMIHIAETGRIRRALEDIGIPLGVFKGWPLGEQLYGAAERRHSGDLDLLVPEDRVRDSRVALEDLGYEVASGTAKARRRLRGLDNPRLISACKDIEMVRSTTGVVVELHWRMLNYHGWPTFYDRPGAMVVQPTKAGDLVVPDVATNLMYLSTHGALHLWHRLKWLTDIAWLARARGAEALARDMVLAHQTGVGRPVLFALSLAHRLLGSPLPEGAVDDPGIAGLECWILARLARPEGRWDKQRYQAGIRWMGLRLSRNWRQGVGVIGYDGLRRLRLASLDLARLWPSRS